MTFKQIFDEIPSGKYHSAILTTYCLDFHFFEEKARRQLQSKGIINISVLADDNMLQTGIGNFTGNLRHLGKSYTVSPANYAHLFHPKINLFIGKENALVLIGSGNLTITGHGKNTEIWSAIRIDGKEDPKASFFLEVFDYLEKYYSNTSNIAAKQKDWIKGECELFKLDSTARRDYYEAKDYQFSFLANKRENSIYQQVLSKLPTQEINEINIVSPYFDLKGQLLHNLLSDFTKAKIKVLIQPNTCLPPIQMENSNRIEFYLWEENITDELLKSGSKKRLHAKMFQFLTDTEEYLIAGSANASLAGFGAKTFINTNAEATLLLKRKKKNWFKDLGITFKGGAISLGDQEFPLLETIDQEQSKDKLSVKVDYVERTVNRFKLNTTGELPLNTVIKVFDGWGNVLHEATDIKVDKNEIHFKVSRGIIDKCLYLRFYSNDIVISNKALIQTVDEIHKTHPSSENLRIRQLLSHLEVNGDNTLALVDYFYTLQTNKKPKIEKTRTALVGSNSMSEGKMEVDFISMTYEEYQKQYGDDISSLFSSNQLQNFNAIKILDIIFKSIDEAEKQSLEKAADNEETEENVDFSTGREESQEKTILKVSSRRVVEKHQTKVITLFEKYRNILASKLHQEQSNISIVDLAMYLINLHILLDVVEKEVHYEDRSGENSMILLKSTGKLNSFNNFAVITYDLLGLFMLLIRSTNTNTEIKEETYFEAKRRAYQQKVFEYSFVCLYCLHENIKDQKEFRRYFFPLFCNVQEVMLSLGFTIDDLSKNLLVLVRQFNLREYSREKFIDFLDKNTKRYNKLAQRKMLPKTDGFYRTEKLGWFNIEEYKAEKQRLYPLAAGLYCIDEELHRFEMGCWFSVEKQGTFIKSRKFKNMTAHLFWKGY